jgi:hydrogenase maturation factor HypF (carbamoyltransferase family)
VEEHQSVHPRRLTLLPASRKRVAVGLVSRLNDGVKHSRLRLEMPAFFGQGSAAVIFDGTGFGTDGTIWGGEILHASMCRFQRFAALDKFALPGGEAAIHEPSRIALALLAGTFGSTEVLPWLLGRIAMAEKHSRVLLTMIDRGINTPQTSSVGRLFDGVAALLLNAKEVSYEGEAALLLENAVDPREEFVCHTDSNIARRRAKEWVGPVRTVRVAFNDAGKTFTIVEAVPPANVLDRLRAWVVF